jgi:aquaporin Z
MPGCTSIPRSHWQCYCGAASRCVPPPGAGFAQLVAGLCAAIAWHVIVGPVQMEAATVLMVDGRTLVAAVAAQLSFTFVLIRVVLSVVGPAGNPSNTLSDFAVGVAVMAGAVDIAALFGGVYLVSQVIAGALAAITFLTFGTAGR